MSADTTNSQSIPFGAGRIISDSFSLFFRNIVKIVILAFVPTVLGLVISGGVNGWGVAFGTEDPSFASGGDIAAFAISSLISMGIYGVTIALLVQLAYDAKQGRHRNIGAYFGPAISAAIPIAILAIVAAFAAGIGTIALVIPGIWIYAVFSVMAPSVVIDRVGFGGLSRSASLTKGYRWPVAGTLIVMLICTLLLGVLVGFVLGVLTSAIQGAAGIVVSLLVSGLLYAFSYGLSGVCVALIYARLREIKEGVSVDDLAAVFD